MLLSSAIKMKRRLLILTLSLLTILVFGYLILSNRSSSEMTVSNSITEKYIVKDKSLISEINKLLFKEYDTVILDSPLTGSYYILETINSNRYVFTFNSKYLTKSEVDDKDISVSSTSNETLKNTDYKIINWDNIKDRTYYKLDKESYQRLKTLVDSIVNKSK